MIRPGPSTHCNPRHHPVPCRLHITGSLTMYVLHTNAGLEYRAAKPTKDEMWGYIRQQRAKGRALADIIFCWTPARLKSPARYNDGSQAHG